MRAEINITPIRANLFSPGPVRTAMRAKAFPGEDPNTLPTPEDVAPQIVAMLRRGLRGERRNCALPAISLERRHAFRLLAESGRPA